MSEGTTTKTKRSLERDLEKKQAKKSLARRYCSARRSRYILCWLREIPNSSKMTWKDDGSEDWEPPSVPSSDSEESKVGASRPRTKAMTAMFNDGSSRPSKTDRLVSDPNYREDHLEFNNIKLTSEKSDGPPPAFVLRTWEGIQQLRGEQSSPLVKEDFEDLIRHQENGISEADFLGFMLGNVLLQERDLERLLGNSDVRMLLNVPFSREAVPGAIQPEHSRVSIPWPDVAYGYMKKAITSLQSLELATITPTRGQVSKELRFPFLVFEAKGSDGNMSVALNQCLGGTATCANAIKGLNSLAEGYGVDPMENIVFGIVMNEWAAAVYAMWWEADGGYFRQQSIARFSFGAEDSVRGFRESLVKILRWGKDVRLKEIATTIDKIREARLERENAPKKRGRPPKKAGDNKRAKNHA
ncbi:hypothetical protein SLS62_004896 [Diatrype stigma]|uniref:DUF7924 domain-containing protein n=1 Tax=Diatrype stigma TaxID=117547 RepID=A0AAN9USJ4_9PEZI